MLLRRAFSPWTAALAFWLFVLLAIALTTWPFEFRLGAEAIRAKWAQTEWVFFYYHHGQLTIDVDLLLNLVFFTPLGVIWVFMVQPPRLWQAVAGSVAVGLALSVLVEGLQVLTPYRTTQLADVWRNTLGAGLGGLAAGVIRPKIERWLEPTEGDGG